MVCACVLDAIKSPSLSLLLYQSRIVNVSDHDGVSRGESVRDRRHRPMSHDDSYGPQLHVPAGCSGEVALPS